MSFAVDPVMNRYRLHDSSGEEAAKATERSLANAWLPIPYHFVFKRGDRELATNTGRAWKLRDTYTIDLSGDPERTLDRRLVLATAMGMGAPGALARR